MLVRFGVRDYDPRIGRWLAKDPSGLQVSLNLYAYAANDPINRSDPTGLDVELCQRVADLPLNQYIGVEHHWIRTATMEAGLGARGGGVPGEGGPPDLPGVDTEIVPHPGRGDRPGSTCTKVPNVSESCVNYELSLEGSRGRWGPTNNCQTVTRDILNGCRTDGPSFNWDSLFGQFLSLLLNGLPPFATGF
jgi:uncharacterized protein RhaS with RHS repeats